MAVRRTKRRYDATRRKAAATETRSAIIEAARHTFLERGYLTATMAMIAQKAGVAVDTIYATIGNKSSLFRLLIELAISGADHPMAPAEREYVQGMQRARKPAEMLLLYARAIRTIHERLAPLFKVLQSAASFDEDLAALWREIAERRATNMLNVANDLKKLGGLRAGLRAEEIADVIWSTNSPEFYLLLVEQRGWAPERFERWLAAAWSRLFLEGA